MSSLHVCHGRSFFLFLLVLFLLHFLGVAHLLPIFSKYISSSYDSSAETTSPSCSLFLATVRTLLVVRVRYQARSEVRTLLVFNTEFNHKRKDSEVD
jgi:hypothetical protein